MWLFGSIFKARSTASLNLLPSFAYKDPCDYIWANQIIQGNWPTSKSLTQSSTSFLPCKVTFFFFFFGSSDLLFACKVIYRYGSRTFEGDAFQLATATDCPSDSGVLSLLPNWTWVHLPNVLQSQSTDAQLLLRRVQCLLKVVLQREQAAHAQKTGSLWWFLGKGF